MYFLRIVVLSLAIMTSVAHAQKKGGGEVGSSGVKEVKNLSTVSFSDIIRGGDRTLTVAYMTGGCSAKSHQTLYDLELKSLRKDTSTEEYEAVVFVKISQQASGGCEMAYVITDTVNLSQLLKQKVKELGLPVDEKNAFIRVVFTTTPAKGTEYLQSN